MSPRGEIVALLQSDLYERVVDAEPETHMTWRSPLGWTVRISGARNAPFVTVCWPDGRVYEGCESVGMTAVELDAVLP